jgi:hypothetical protein
MDIGRPTQRSEVAHHLLWRSGYDDQRDRPQSDASISKYQGSLRYLLVVQHGCEFPSKPIRLSLILDSGWTIDPILDQRDLCRRLGKTSFTSGSRERLCICPTSYRPEFRLENCLLPERSKRIHLFNRSTSSS